MFLKLTEFILTFSGGGTIPNAVKIKGKKLATLFLEKAVQENNHIPYSGLPYGSKSSNGHVGEGETCFSCAEESRLYLKRRNC